MCIASGLGMITGAEMMMTDEAFTETPGRYLVELRDVEQLLVVRDAFAGVAEVIDVGLVQHFHKLTITSKKERVLEIGLDELTEAWRGTLDW
jgi:hypothetical protein